MIAAHPFLGVGPGHWSVYYPEVAVPGDPSWRPDAGQPVNRFPNSDILALASERGIPTVILFICAALSLGIWALRRIREESQTPDNADGWLILFTLGAAILLGLTDSVLLRPEPLIFLAVVLGVTSGNQPIWKRWQMHSLARPFGFAVIGMSVVFATFLGVRCYAGFLKLDRSLESTRKAWVLDRGDYVIGTNLARRLYLLHDYEGSIIVLSNVLRLYPHSRAAQNILLACQRKQFEESLDR